MVHRVVDMTKPALCKPTETVRETRIVFVDARFNVQVGRLPSNVHFYLVYAKVESAILTIHPLLPSDMSSVATTVI